MCVCVSGRNEKKRWVTLLLGGEEKKNRNTSAVINELALKKKRANPVGLRIKSVILDEGIIQIS